MIEKGSAAVAYGGGGAAAVSGVVEIFGLTQGEWSVVGIIGGLAIGALGWATNAFFQWLRYRRGQ